jgi:adenylosuccinate synthase
MGDEGKGKIVDVLTSKYDIARFQVDQMLDTL